jgi:hypothetical protein
MSFLKVFDWPTDSYRDILSTMVYRKKPIAEQLLFCVMRVFLCLFSNKTTKEIPFDRATATENKLTITGLVKEDSGIYECSMENGTVYRISLDVTPKPLSPSKLKDKTILQQSNSGSSYSYEIFEESSEVVRNTGDESQTVEQTFEESEVVDNTAGEESSTSSFWSEESSSSSTSNSDYQISFSYLIYSLVF